MLTQIPAFARGLLDVYQATGAVPQLTQRLEITDIQEVDRMARNLADRFAWWSRLDGSDADRYLALPNEIYLQTEHGYQQASLQGDATAGQVVLVKLEPASHGGFEFAVSLRKACLIQPDMVSLGKGGPGQWQRLTEFSKGWPTSLLFGAAKIHLPNRFRRRSGQMQ